MGGTNGGAVNSALGDVDADEDMDDDGDEYWCPPRFAAWILLPTPTPGTPCVDKYVTCWWFKDIDRFIDILPDIAFPLVPYTPTALAALAARSRSSRESFESLEGTWRTNSSMDMRLKVLGLAARGLLLLFSALFELGLLRLSYKSADKLLLGMRFRGAAAEIVAPGLSALLDR
jgi:hypothetical protein